jgi:predicted outer membrane repeat protein
MKGADYVNFEDITLSRDPGMTAQAPNPADGAIRVSPEPLLNIHESDDVPLVIPDRGRTMTTVYSSLGIPESFTITDLNVQVDITMPNSNGDLNVFLIGPDGTRVELFTDVGLMSKDDFKNTILDDEASISVRDGRGRFEGTYRPEGKLSKFDGKNAHGTWKLEITDDWANNVGTLNSWKLIIESPNVLSWIPADMIASQDVYISKNLDEVNDSAEAAFHGNFAPHVSTMEIILEVGQQYFWRIDSVDADGAVIATGDVWTFWTTPDPIFVNPDSDLAAANELAIPGGIIEFAPGTYNITSQIIVKEAVTYLGAGPDLTILDGGGATRAFAAWGDRGATNGQVDAEGNGITNLTGPTRWVIEGMTIQNGASDEVNRQDILSSARDLLTNYTGTPYTLETASEENGGIAENPEAFAALSGGEDDDLTDEELQAYLDANPPGSEGHYVVNDDKRDDGGAICILNGADGTVRNCAFSNNTAVDDGGAILVDGWELDVTIEDCTFNLNTCGDVGGAISLSGAGSNSTIIGCSFTENSAPEDDGGAIKMEGAGSVGSVYTLTDCTFTGCTANDDGGAIFANADNSTYVWTDCAFIGNHTGDDGAAVKYAPDRAELTVANCVFIGNGKDADGTVLGDDGVWNTADDDAGSMTFMNCLFADNACNDDRLVELKAAFELLNCTFIGNEAGDKALIAVRGRDWNSTGATDDNGDDIDDVTTDDSIIANCLFINNTMLSDKRVIGDTRNDVFAPTVINCLFFGNIDEDGETAANTDDNSVEVGTIDVSGVTDAAQIVVDPAGDYHIAEGSMAIDASDPDTATASDIVGMPAYGIRDVGAYESEFDPPPTIAWVSYHAADDEPHADAAAHGFTQAPDIDYTNLLKAQGYKVVRVVTSQEPDVEFLNTMDLVIISRTASSGHYSGSGASLWNSVTAPTINLNGYTLRSSRMGFTDGTTMVDTTGDVKLTVTDPNHPIFAGIALTDGTMDNPFAEGAVPLPTDETIISRGISINDNNIDDEGTLLATIAEVSADTGPVGGMMIAEYPAGATMQNSSGSPDDVLGGSRLVFLTGSREPSGVTGGQAAALYDLYEDGEQMFINAVAYMLQ